MGASVAKPQKLSAEEKQILKKSWQKVHDNRATFVTELFIKVFQQIDGAQDMFEQLKGLSPDQLRADKKMKAHCVRVAGILNTVILELDDPATMVEMFRNIARTHYKLGNQLGQSQYDKFAEIFLGCLASEFGAALDAKTKAVWEKGAAGMVETLLVTKQQLEAAA